MEDDLRLIDKMEKIRSKNNVNWMDLIRLAIKLDPEKTKFLIRKILRCDKELTNLLEKLSK